MKAIAQDRYGSTAVLQTQDIDVRVADDEVLVRVHAASIHVGDWILMTGRPYVMRLGTGCAGRRTRSGDRYRRDR